jgi:hypothetical protein
VTLGMPSGFKPQISQISTDFNSESGMMNSHLKPICIERWPAAFGRFILDL